jgi:hypothetical protein
MIILPKKMRIYIVTYQGHKRINPTLNSILESDVAAFFDYEIFIINNHSDLRLSEYHKHHPQITVLENTLRPDFSSGHLSRNWNQALVNGFESLTNPACDVVVCSQDDSIFFKCWAYRLRNLFWPSVDVRENLTFVQNGHGDQFHAYLPEAVRQVGLWDERFCGISRQAADYFWRCCMYNQEHSSIQDPIHHRVLNPIVRNLEVARNWLVDSDVRQLDEVWDNTPHNNGAISAKLIEYKYGTDPYPWTPAKLEMAKRSHTLTPNHITYPYFEKDVYDLEQKGYLV